MWTRFWTRLRQIQSNVYLPTARTTLLVVALGAFVATVISLLVAAYFQLQSWHSAPSAVMPPPYVRQTPKIAIDLVAARLTGPTDIRFVSYSGLISSPLDKDQVLGQFEADAVNGLPAPPSDFSLLGGTDVDFFTPVRGSAGPILRNPVAHYPHLLGNPQATFRYGLAASEALNDLVRKAVASGKTQTRAFSVRVIAFDKLGNKSAPQDVSFTLQFGPEPPKAEKANSVTPAIPAAQPAEPPVQQTPLTILAHEIALISDPKRGPTFFKIFRQAVDVPRTCGVNPDNAAFIADYRKAFEFVKQSLTQDNVSTGFLPSVCVAWRAGVAAEDQAEASANEARMQALAAAGEAEVRANLKNAGARVERNFALTVVLGAIGVLLLISLPLALLLLENHSSALRVIAERLEADHALGHPREEIAT